MRLSAADQALTDVLTEGSSLTQLDIDLAARRASLYVEPFVEPGDGTVHGLSPTVLELRDVSRIQLWTNCKALVAPLGTDGAPAPELLRLIARTFLGPVHAEWTPFGLKLGPTYPQSQRLWDLKLAPAATEARVFAGQCHLDALNILVLLVEFGTLQIGGARQLSEVELLAQVRAARAAAMAQRKSEA